MTLKTVLVTWMSGLLIISVAGTKITVCSSQIDGTPCQIICETTDFSQAVIFRRDGNSAGFCSSLGACSTAIPGYVAPYREGVNRTVLNISAYDRTRDPGGWTCSYGISASPIETMYYAIPPTSATVTPNNYTVNTTTQIIVRTECAYINISGIIQFKDRTYSQNQPCTEVPSGGCASGTGEKYTCTFTLKQGYMATGTYELEFRVDLPYDNTNPKVILTTPVYVTFPDSSSGSDSSCQCERGCWICNICDKFIFALLFFLFDLWRFGLREILGRQYKKCFRVEKLEVIRNSKSSKIACVKRFIDEREITENWQYSKENGYAFCNDTFENTEHSVCNVTLDNQHNLTFDFNLEGCENDKNVTECIGFEKKIKLEWSHARNTEQCTPPASNIYNPKNVLVYHSETDEEDMPVINVIIFFSLYIPDMKKRIKIRIWRFLMIFFIILVLAVIITAFLRCYQVNGFCCKGWVIPVAALVSLLAIPFYFLLLFVALNIRHEKWIVEKSWKDFPDEKTSLVRFIQVLFGRRGCSVSPDSSQESLTENVQAETATRTDASLHEARETDTTRYIGNSLLDKKRYNEPLPPLTVVETTNNSIPLGKGGRLDPVANQQVENPDSLVTTSVKKKTKNKKKKKVAQDINESQEDKI